MQIIIFWWLWWRERRVREGEMPLTTVEITHRIKALFTSRIFEGMGGDYFVSQNFPDRLFTSPVFEEIIPGYPHKSPPL
jgi:hypothetical protein